MHHSRPHRIDNFSAKEIQNTYLENQNWLAFKKDNLAQDRQERGQKEAREVLKRMYRKQVCRLVPRLSEQFNIFDFQHIRNC